MRILYDHQIFTRQIYGGISRYFYELMELFRTAGEPDFDLAVSYTNNHYINLAHPKSYKTFLKNKNFRGKLQLMSILNGIKTKSALSLQNFDIFHPTYYNPYFLQLLGRRPFVLTVYDMIHEKFPEQFPSGDKTFQHKKQLAEKAAKIIAISKNTKQDIMKIFNIDEKKITVIYLGNSLNASQMQNDNNPIYQKYILFVGSRGAYKNFDFFIKSISPLIIQDIGLHVVCAGGPQFSSYEKSIFEKLKIEKRVHYLSVTDKELEMLYRGALAFVFPSLYEGFGIPVLEAFSCECPVVLSNTGSLPEVGGDAAVYFDPRDEDSIVGAVRKVIYDEDVRCHYKAKGKEQLRNFSWEMTANETREVYKGVLGKH